jgi:hypothetical protein
MKALLSKIPPTRLFLYLLLAGLLPFLVALFYHHTRSNRLEALYERVEDLKQRAMLKEKTQEINKSVIETYSNADRFYIDKNIESIPLLQTEIEVLEKIAKQSNFVENEEVTNRLEQLKTENQLRFSEGVVQTYPLFSETVETLVKPVEVDSKDLQNILAKIEGVEIGPYTQGDNPPQLIISELRLEKKDTNAENEVFQLQLKLIKREFTP